MAASVAGLASGTRGELPAAAEAEGSRLLFFSGVRSPFMRALLAAASAATSWRHCPLEAGLPGVAPPLHSTTLAPIPRASGLLCGAMCALSHDAQNFVLAHGRAARLGPGSAASGAAPAVLARLQTNMLSTPERVSPLPALPAPRAATGAWVSSLAVASNAGAELRLGAAAERRWRGEARLLCLLRLLL